MDRKRLLKAAAESSKFFLGTDSAPHAVGRKEGCCGCAGCFTAHAAVEMVAEALESDRMDALEDFVSKRGAAFYGLPESTSLRILRREAWKVPDSYTFGDTTVRPLRAGEEMHWKLQGKDKQAAAIGGYAAEAVVAAGA